MVLDKDAFAVEARCMLLQQHTDDIPKPVSSWSESLNVAKRKYSKATRECLKIVWAVFLLRFYFKRTWTTSHMHHE